MPWLYLVVAGHQFAFLIGLKHLFSGHLHGVPGTDSIGLHHGTITRHFRLAHRVHGVALLLPELALRRRSIQHRYLAHRASMLVVDHAMHLQHRLAVVLHKLDLASVHIAATEAEQASLSATVSAQLVQALAHLGAAGTAAHAGELAWLLGDRVEVLEALTLIPSQLIEVND